MNKSENPVVSVVIPTYNNAHYIGQALQSVLDQSYSFLEAIIIDNHSTDNTDEVVARFTDPRITYLKIHNNGVIASSRNAGIEAAKGEWIAFLDSDDRWTTDKLQECLGVINEKVDLIYHDMKIVSDSPRYFRQKKIESWQVNSPVLIDLMVRGNAIATSSVLVRTKLIKQIGGMNESPEMVAAEDYNAWLRIAQLTNGFCYVPKRLGYYQLDEKSISSQKDMSVPAQHAVSEFVRLLMPQQKNKLESHLSYTRGRFNYMAGDIDTAKKNLLFSLKHGRVLIKLKSALVLFLILVLKKIH